MNNDLRKSANRALVDEQRVLVGVDIGGTKTAVVLSRELPDVLARVEFQTLQEFGPAHAMEKILEGVADLLAASGLASSDIAAIGVSCGGPLDRHKGIIQSPPNLPSWVDVPIVQILTDQFGVSCHLENDANAGAVAEHRFGAGRGTQNMIFLTMGTGLGAGMVLNGQLYRGASEMAGEFGHVRLTESGPVGHNKPGSVEGWVSGNGMAQAALEPVREAAQRGIRTTLQPFAEHGMLTPRHIAAAALEGDEVAQQIIHSTGQRLGEALAIVIDILNPECIVIGGLAMRLGEALLGPARAVLEREALPAAARACKLVAAALGESIGDVAALCVATGLTAEHHVAESVRP